MIIAGTGHRPDKLGGYTSEVRKRCSRVAFLALRQYRPEIVVSGMALGWDTALAVAAMGLEIPFIAAVPFKGQEARWPSAEQQMYRQVLARAMHVEYVCEPGYAAWKMQRRNEWMVDELAGPQDFVLALWDGSDGGTANCVRYAKKRGKYVINVWDVWKAAA